MLQVKRKNSAYSKSMNHSNISTFTKSDPKLIETKTAKCNEKKSLLSCPNRLRPNSAQNYSKKFELKSIEERNSVKRTKQSLNLINCKGSNERPKSASIVPCKNCEQVIHPQLFHILYFLSLNKVEEEKKSFFDRLTD